ncbi:hypothetical protein SAMN03159494_05183 [Achromobacter sp. NFACC18-2]|nr:hypothetical protein SAMN03159494_05183 [Achromobacter sp. NFACC18-2]
MTSANQNWRILESVVEGRTFYEPQVKSCWGNWKPLRFRLEYGELSHDTRTEHKNEALYELRHEGYITEAELRTLENPPIPRHRLEGL